MLLFMKLSASPFSMQDWTSSEEPKLAFVANVKAKSRLYVMLMAPSETKKIGRRAIRKMSGVGINVLMNFFRLDSAANKLHHPYFC